MINIEKMSNGQKTLLTYASLLVWAFACLWLSDSLKIEILRLVAWLPIIFIFFSNIIFRFPKYMDSHIKEEVEKDAQRDMDGQAITIKRIGAAFLIITSIIIIGILEK